MADVAVASSLIEHVPVVVLVDPHVRILRIAGDPITADQAVITIHSNHAVGTTPAISADDRLALFVATVATVHHDVDRPVRMHDGRGVPVANGTILEVGWVVQDGGGVCLVLPPGASRPKYSEVGRDGTAHMLRA
eukprot:CAMPEP_0181205810 /NCGR_PEP_ID=MMETSP1096-20121128/20679_1 /TAXON_ID=156174 ORGANISM="Chrysochromulina ericina, Strain CCMP281" /NCGR_SAMPLE_ID=MMETSP1096 /ASSEMBLY_ACC=CAM_ASM_000453 /LENGTH=134 /DNA_ID=CAMNT_0023296625 /DNA_START=767 /DNA_END=1171 /DNA_ORIENTATION=-